MTTENSPFGSGPEDANPAGELYRNPPVDPVVEQVVGQIDLPPDDFKGYDERRLIVAEVEQAVERLRERHLGAARHVGLTISEEQVAAWRPGPQEIALLRKELKPLRHRANMILAAETYIHDQVMEAAAEGIRMRPHQQDVVIGVRNFLVGASRTSPKGGKSGLIELPTGAGKTRVMVEVASMIRHIQDPEEQNKILIITPTNKIQQQTVGLDGKHGFGRFRPDEEVGKYDEDTPANMRPVELGKNIVSICLPSFLRLKAQGRLPKDISLVLVDETHMARGDKVGAEIEDYIADKVAIGFDATPERDEDEDSEAVYEIFKHQIAQMDLVEAIKSGILTSVRAWVKHVRPVVNERSLPTEPRARRDALREASTIAKERSAAELVKEELERGYREVPGRQGERSKGFGVVVRCRPGGNVNYAYRFAKSLRHTYVHGPLGPFDLREVMPAFVGGDSKRQTKAVREEVFDGYARKHVNVLANVKAAEVGWDDNGAKAFINTYRARRRQLIQASGRVLRIMLDDDGEIVKGPDGKPIPAHIYDLVDDSELADPSRPTILDILGIESGGIIEADAHPDAPIPRPRTIGHDSGGFVRSPEVTDVVTTTVGSTALGGEEVNVAVEDVGAVTVEPDTQPEVTRQPREAPVNPIAPSGWPNQSGLAEFAEAYGDAERVPHHEAARILGVSTVTLSSLLKGFFGDAHYAPTFHDLQSFLEQNPGLQAPPQPAVGFVEISRKDRKVRRYASEHGVSLRRFTREDGVIVQFMRQEDLQELLRIAQEDNQ